MSAVFGWDQITKRFGKQVALDRFSLSSEPGSVVALLGDNGAGKTTAIRILLGLLEPTTGRSQVFGLDSQAHGQTIRQRVGYVPERPALYEWMTIEQIGWFTAGFYADGFYQRFCEYVGQFGLPIDKKIKTLSKGMRSKVSLALCMGHEPELLVLDEPTSGLDPVVRREFLESMVDVAARGRTVLLSWPSNRRSRTHRRSRRDHSAREPVAGRAARHAEGRSPRDHADSRQRSDDAARPRRHNHQPASARAAMASLAARRRGIATGSVAR